MWGTLLPYTSAWVSAASLAQSGASIHLDATVISEKEKWKDFSSHLIKPPTYRSSHKSKLVLGPRIPWLHCEFLGWNTKRIRPLVCTHLLTLLSNAPARWTWSKDFCFIQFRFTSSQDNHCSHRKQWPSQLRQKAENLIVFSAQTANQVP